MGSQQSTPKGETGDDVPALITVSPSVVDRLNSSSENELFFKPRSKHTLNQEYKKTKEYWTHRLSKQKKNHEHLEKILEAEYMKAAEEIEQILPKMEQNLSEKEFKEVSQNVKTCLQKNSREPLACFKELEAFNKFLDATKTNKEHLVI